MKHLLTLGFLFMAIVTYGQKRQLVEFRGNVVGMAIAELDSVTSHPEGSLKKAFIEKGIRGQYVFDITIREKGQVATVFVINNGENPVAMQNSLKDIIKRYRFSFKVPKGKSYKFQYTFNL